MLPEMNTKELTATAVGAGHLSLPANFTRPLLAALEGKVRRAAETPRV